jgi:hypothetical protein
MGIKHLNQYFTKKCSSTSIKKIHFEDLYDKIIVIDPKIDIIKKQLENYPGVDIEYKKSIYEISSGKSIALIVISNWGPDHFSVLKHFAVIGSLKCSDLL